MLNTIVLDISDLCFFVKSVSTVDILLHVEKAQVTSYNGVMKLHATSDSLVTFILVYRVVVTNIVKATGS